MQIYIFVLYDIINFTVLLRTYYETRAQTKGKSIAYRAVISIIILKTLRH